MDAAYQEYFRLLEQLGGKLEELAGIQREKTAAVRRDDLAAVNECMKQEQVISLSLRSMDQKRDRLLEQLGLQGVPLSGLASRCPLEYRPRARELAQWLRARYDVYHSAADVARTTLEMNLHQIEKIIADEADEPASPGAMADIRA